MTDAARDRASAPDRGCRSARPGTASGPISPSSVSTTRVELCLFDDAGQNERCVPLRR